ncbi:unnamed protein product [Spirodela intermedia]|uniref:RING-type E3 ubiquitin transferase n=1 Tax=Spirodela intermedia TaxID=51605 RepID=A0A7I8JTA0_SPIIN|nr:unnamed protein product [Spirodela intermedia]CAA6673398.1 unnamed protein product [Spirodela intermedia]
MSAAEGTGGPGGGGGFGAYQQYYCHECERPVLQPRPPPLSDVACPLCYSGFLEEHEPGDPYPESDPFWPQTGREILIWFRILRRLGGAPAARSAVEALPDVEVAAAAPCAICKETLEAGDTAKEMPCGHAYHAGCLLPWLDLHNTCPTCRYELPTDDRDDDFFNEILRRMDPAYRRHLRRDEDTNYYPAWNQEDSGQEIRQEENNDGTPE